MSLSAVRTQVLRGYKELLKTQGIVFGTDISTKKTARIKTREIFKENKMENDPQKIEEMLTNLQDAIEFLKANVIQAVVNERGNYGEKFFPKIQSFFFFFLFHLSLYFLFFFLYSLFRN